MRSFPLLKLAFKADGGSTLDPRDFSGELFVHGLGHFHPESVIENSFLASLGIDCWSGMILWIGKRLGRRKGCAWDRSQLIARWAFRGSGDIALACSI